jgi:hypothetical protein
MFKIPSETKPALWGAFAGAIIVSIVGFTWGGWVTPKSAQEQASQHAREAVVAVLAPICADKFRQNVNAVANLEEMKKIDSWRQGTFVKKGGWATFSGSENADTAIADACAKLLGAPKPS